MIIENVAIIRSSEPRFPRFNPHQGNCRAELSAWAWQNMNMSNTNIIGTFRIAVTIFALALVSLTSCQKRSPNFAFNAPSGNDQSLLWQELEADTENVDGDDARILWYAHYVGGSKIGHRRFTMNPVKNGKEPLIRIATTDHLVTLRFSKRNEQDLTQASLEYPSGAIHSFGYTIASGDNNSRVEGTVSGQLVKVTRLDDNNPEESFSMSWPTNGPSIFAIEKSLWDDPMTEGETRDVRVYRPLPRVMTSVRLTALEMTEVDIAGEQRRLLRIDGQNVSSKDLAAVSTYWVDETGTIVKTEYPFMNRTMVLVTKDVANSANSPHRVDLGFGGVIRSDADFDTEKKATAAIYKVTLKSLPPEKLFAQGLSQRLRMAPNNTAQVVVRTISPDFPPRLKTPETPPTDDDRTANALVDCNDHRVKAFAEAVTSRNQDPWKTAKALESAVFAQLSKNETSQVFDSAGLVVEKGTGDCSEHAVLLAAACRNFGIPARVVVGLIYDKSRGGFLYHMWNEVWISDRWLPLDATVGEGRVGVDHIKFHHSSLAGQSPYNIVTPIVNVMGQLEIELSGLKYD